MTTRYSPSPPERERAALCRKSCSRLDHPFKRLRVPEMQLLTQRTRRAFALTLKDTLAYVYTYIRLAPSPRVNSSNRDRIFDPEKSQLHPLQLACREKKIERSRIFESYRDHAPSRSATERACGSFITRFRDLLRPR